MISENCKDRLCNWKFEQASKYLGELEPDERERELVTALAEVFGDSGWLDGRMSPIIGAAVSTLVPEENDEPWPRQS